jgi:hypothetical protein
LSHNLGRKLTPGVILARSTAKPDGLGFTVEQEIAETNKLVHTIYTDLRHYDEDHIAEKVRCEFPNYKPAHATGPK